jgi:enamine deaminase RidA (YjgF/YER057c/UK114 family)
MIDDLLAQSGSSKNHLLSVTVYLQDMNDYAGMNKVWDAWLNQGLRRRVLVCKRLWQS